VTGGSRQPVKAHVRRGQNKNAVPAERAALCFRPSHLVLAPGQNKSKTQILNETKMHLAPKKALPLGRSLGCMPKGHILAPSLSIVRWASNSDNPGDIWLR